MTEAICTTMLLFSKWHAM